MGYLMCAAYNLFKNKRFTFYIIISLNKATAVVVVALC